MAIEAVIFDMDGVLADTEPLHLKTLKELLTRFGVELAPGEEDEFFGSTDERMFTILKARYGLEPDAKKLGREREALMLSRFKGEIEPAPGARRLLEALEAGGVPRALASSSSRDVIDATLEAIGFSSAFVEIVSGPEVENAKPAPDIFLEAARRLGKTPEECLVIEDSMNGVHAAKAAGMTCLAVPCHATRRQDHSRADRIIGSLADISIEELLNLNG